MHRGGERLNNWNVRVGYGDLPAIEGVVTAAGSVSFGPGTITFLTIERSGKLRLPRFLNKSSNGHRRRGDVHPQMKPYVLVRRFRAAENAGLLSISVRTVETGGDWLGLFLGGAQG